MKISNKNIGACELPFIVAELSGNHNQSLDRALLLVDQASAAGVDAIKIQTFSANSMTIESDSPDFLASPSSVWAGRTLHSLYSESSLPFDWHAPIMQRAKDLGLLCFSTPFDEVAVDFLEEIGCPAYKIASFECIDLPLIARVANTGKPLIISTGMATISEISEAVETARVHGCSDLIVLKCTSSYPAPPGDINLRTIAHMRNLFQCEVGLSDHTMGIGVSVAAIAFGATFIEKHLTLSREDGGVDAAFSLEPDEFKSLVVECRRAWEALGEIRYGPTDAELKSRERRRSLYVTDDIEQGAVFTENNVRRIRPGKGLEPKYWEIVLGRRASRAIKKGTPLNWDLIA